MAKLTNAEIYKHFTGKMDKANASYLSEGQMQVLYTEARLEWLRLKTKDFEVSTLQRSDLRPFIREQEFGKVKELPITDETEIAFIAAVWGNFVFQCEGSERTLTRPYKALTIDEAAESMGDPFNQPNDEFPAYVERRNEGGVYLDLLSTNAPEDVTVFFIKEPKPFDLLNDPDGYTEESQSAQFDIIDIAVKKGELSIENLNKFQGMREEITSNG